MRSLLLIAFAGAALAQQFLDDEVAPVAKTAAGFTTTADITNGTTVPVLTGSAASPVPEITIAKTGYTLSGTADALTVTATMDIRVVMSGVTLGSTNVVWITWSTFESGLMHAYQLMYVPEATRW